MILKIDLKSENVNDIIASMEVVEKMKKKELSNYEYIVFSNDVLSREENIETMAKAVAQMIERKTSFLNFDYAKENGYVEDISEFFQKFLFDDDFRKKADKEQERMNDIYQIIRLNLLNMI